MITGMFCLTNHLKLSGVSLLWSLDSGAHAQKGYTGDALFLLHYVLGLGKEDLKRPVAWCWNNLDVHSLMSSLG